MDNLNVKISSGTWDMLMRWKPRDFKLNDVRVYPGASLPFRARDIEPIFYDFPVTAQFPCNFNVTRWPEGAEL